MRSMNPGTREARLTIPSKRLLKDVAQIRGNVIVLGAGGKMGPSLCVLLQKAFSQNGQEEKVWAVSRFSNPQILSYLAQNGIETISGDLLDPTFVDSLPEAPNVIYMAGQKFGTTKNENLTWAMNVYLPCLISRRYTRSRVVIFSTGNVYPLTAPSSGGASETTPPDPIGEYAQSCLGRERIFKYFSDIHKTPMLFFRLNYALDLTYGVLNDIGRRVWTGKPIDLTMGFVNLIWQGDANEYAIRTLLHATHPATVINVTGLQTHPVEALAIEIGVHLGCKPIFTGTPATTALLSSAKKMEATLGPPGVDINTMCRWTAEWILQGGEQLGKPTHYQIRDGKF